MADDDRNTSLDEAAAGESEEGRQNLSIRGNNYWMAPKGWREEAAKLDAEKRNAEAASKSKAIDDKDKSKQVVRFEDGLKEVSQKTSEKEGTKHSAEQLEDAVNWAKSNLGDGILKSGDGESKDVVENDGKEAEPVISSGSNMSIANDPASLYAQKFGLRANILDADEEVNEISGISLVRYSDEEQKEHNGAYRVTYDFTSGDTINRLFASYDVYPAVRADKNEQAAENSQHLSAEQEKRGGENDKDKADEKRVNEKTTDETISNNDKDKEKDETIPEQKDEAVFEQVKPDILVNMEQLQEYLKFARNDKPNEFFDVDKENNKFNFSLCGAEGVFDSKNKTFQKLSINGQPVSEEDLKNYSGTQLFNMVPMGAMLGDAAEKPVTAKSLEDMASRDQAIAACKDERLQELFKEIDGSCKRMTKFSRQYAGERNKITELDYDIGKASIPARMWNRLANKFNFYGESEAVRTEHMGSAKKFFYEAMKPSRMSNAEKKIRPEEKMRDFETKIAEQYKFFKAQYEELQNVINSLPAETAAQYSEELGRLSEGMKCFKEWEEYRNSSVFDPKKASHVKNYAECMTHNCELIAKDLGNCAKKLSHVHDESCHCCYDRQITERSLQERIDNCDVKAGYGVAAIDNYRAFAKSATNDEISVNGSVDAVAVDKMLALKTDRNKIVEALAQGSKRFAGESNDVIGSFVDSRINKMNDVKSRGDEADFNQNSLSERKAPRSNLGRSGGNPNGSGHSGKGSKSSRGYNDGR